MGWSLEASILANRLLAESPLLLAAMIGLVFAAITLRRAARICCVLGCVTLLIGTLLLSFVHVSFVASRAASAMPIQQFSHYINLLGIGTGAMRAVAFALILTSAMVGRSRSHA